MKRTCWVCMLVFGLMLSWNLVYAVDFYVIPVQKCCTCKGTLVGTRWCDNEDGTVTDMTTCLVWLKKADWGGSKKWEDCTTHDDAHTRAAILKAADYTWLTDGSVEGDWRLPTKTELLGLAYGTEGVSSGAMRAFIGVLSANYWSSTTLVSDPSLAWVVDLNTGNAIPDGKNAARYVWPVRGQ